MVQTPAAARPSDHAPGKPRRTLWAARRQNLPISYTSFIGRERELAEVQGLLDSTRLLSLTGSGGVGLALAERMRDRQGIADALESFAWAAAAVDQSERAGLLLGAAAAVRESIAMLLFPFWQPDQDRAEAVVHDKLGEAAYRAAFAAGHTMSLDDAIAFALADQPRQARARQPDIQLSNNGLTPREREVASLLASGLSNRQLAEELVITEGTAAIHVRNILGKLGFSSRAQVAAWAVRSGLDG